MYGLRLPLEARGDRARAVTSVWHWKGKAAVATGFYDTDGTKRQIRKELSTATVHIRYHIYKVATTDPHA